MRVATIVFVVLIVSACNHGAAPSSPGAADVPYNTFNHENVQVSDLQIASRDLDEGDPSIAVHLHSCQKLKYATLGKLLASRGVNMSNPDAGSAAGLYKNGSQAIGAPDYAARTSEAVVPTTAGGTKLDDIFIAAAPEIIANIGTAPDAQLGGKPVAIFDSTGACTTDGLTALAGYPATAQQVTICNQIVSSSSTPQVGQRVAVAAFLSSANFCE